MCDTSQHESEGSAFIDMNTYISTGLAGMHLESLASAPYWSCIQSTSETWQQGITFHK